MCIMKNLVRYDGQLTGNLAVRVQLHVRNLFDYLFSLGNRKITPIYA